MESQKHLFTIVTMIIPIVILIVSVTFSKNLPKKINFLYGYRTKKSMISQINWDIANKYSANLMVKSSIILLIINSIWAILGYDIIILIFRTYNYFMLHQIMSTAIIGVLTVILTEKRLDQL